MAESELYAKRQEVDRLEQASNQLSGELAELQKQNEELKEQVKEYKKSLGLSDLPPPKVSPTIFVTVGLYFFLACFLCD